MEFFTIGHSNHTLEHFLDLLGEHNIALLADIRRFPGSKKFPHFKREALEAAVEAKRIEYRWLERLGGRRSKAGTDSPSPNEGLRNQSFRNYADYMLTETFQSAFDELVDLAEAKRTAIMCSESVFWRCHRRLVSDFALGSGATVKHIFPDGRVQEHRLTSGAKPLPGEPTQIIYPGEPRLF